MAYQESRALTAQQRAALAVMQAYLIQKDIGSQAEAYLSKLRVQLLDFMNLFSEMTQEEVKYFDRTVMQYVVTADSKTEELQIAPGFGQPEFLKEQESTEDKAPKNITSVSQVANMIADNMKRFIRSTNVIVTEGGDRILTLSSSMEG
jgi:hypothetical protein